MSIITAKQYLAEKGFEDRIIEPEESTATVSLAAKALGIEEGQVAKTVGTITPDGPVLILVEGNARLHNRKYKDAFHTKAAMIKADEVEELVGHAPGGVCPFGIKEGVRVYLDTSLQKYDWVYPAAGNDHSGVRLTPQELFTLSGALDWIDVCKEPE